MADNIAVTITTPDAEAALLGSIIVDSTILDEINSIIDQNDFFYLKHKYIFAAINAIYQRGESIDHITINSELQANNHLLEIGGSSYILDLVNKTPSSQHFMAYATLIKKASVRRNLLNVSELIKGLAYQEDKTLDEILVEVEKILSEINTNTDGVGILHVADVGNEYLDIIAARQSGNQGIMGIPTGFPTFDKHTGGLAGGNLVTVAAVTTMGKSIMLMNIAYNMVCNGYKVLFFSYEMGRYEQLRRFQSRQLGINSKALKLGTMTKDEWQQYGDSLTELKNYHLLIDDKGDKNVEQLVSVSRLYKRREGLDAIIVDYLQIMPESIKNANRTISLGHITRSLKNMARSLNIPIIIAAQVSRSVENNTGNIPHLSNLRESGSIEHDSDIVVFIHSDDYWDENRKYSPQWNGSLIIAKNREGDLGKIQILIDKPITTITEIPNNPF